MKSDQIANFKLNGPCSYTKQWEGIRDRQDHEAAAGLDDHLQICPSCRAEVKRINYVVERNTGFRGFMKNFMVGFVGMAVLRAAWQGLFGGNSNGPTIREMDQ